MPELLRTISKNFSTLLLAFILALAVWISAVTASDPMESRLYPRPVMLEIIGQDPGLVLTSEIPSQITMTLSAPVSIWTRLINEQIPVRAIIDLSNAGPGTTTVGVQIQVGVGPVRVVSHSPRTLNVTLEPLSSRIVPISLLQTGEPAIGFQAATPVLSQLTATVRGAESIVKQVQEVRAILDLNQSKENVNRMIELQAVDANGSLIEGLTISPSRVTVSVAITQRGGYRNVVVKVVVSGQVAGGYRVTNISVFPPAITVFSSDPKLVDDLPGYVETASLNLNAARDDIDTSLPLNLPPGVSVVGDQTVAVQVGVAAIEGSLTLENMEVLVNGLVDGYEATISPASVDVILSGPLPLLDELRAGDVRVVVELNGETEGVYQRVPRVELKIPELRVESILPGSIEITVTPVISATPTLRN